MSRDFGEIQVAPERPHLAARAGTNRRLAEEFFEAVREYVAHSKEELRSNRTFATAARILMELVDAKRTAPDWSPYL
jgi:hypothetical protein